MKSLRFLNIFAPVLFFYFFFPLTTSGQESQEALMNLIGIVVESDSIDIEIPEDLQFIVQEYYADAIISESTTNDVLSYLVGVYSEHGFHENGCWVRPTIHSSYKPYAGELPEYSNEDFKFPISSGRLTSRFGYRPNFGRFHKGIDVSLNIGDTVRSALPGIVSKVGYDKNGYGHYVVVAHSGSIETLYGHLLLSTVVVGQHLNSGEALGLGGSTGNSSGPHLHFETRYRGTALDPISWFGLGKEFR